MVSVSIQSAFGNFLRELREKAGLHIDQLAEKSGLSTTCLSAIERGEVNLNLETMVILAMSMDTSPQELFSEIAGRIGRREPVQIESKQLWIGTIEVRPLVGCELVDMSEGAIVEIVAWAGRAYEYGLSISSVVRELRLFILSVADVEPVEHRRKRQGFLEESVEEIIFKAQGDSRLVVCGTFHTYPKTDV